MRALLFVPLAVLVACVAIAATLHARVRDQERRIADNDARIAEARAAVADDGTLRAEYADVERRLAALRVLESGRRAQLHAWLALREAEAAAGAEIPTWSFAGGVLSADV